VGWRKLLDIELNELYRLIDIVKLKDRKRSLSEKKKKTTAGCGIRETATTRNFVI